MPSAHEIGPEGWKKYIHQSLHSIKPNQDFQRSILRKKLIDKASNAAVILKNQFGANKVILFGSLIHEDWFVDNSDIDFAVDGIAHEDYWKAWGIVESFFPDRVIDFVDLNDLNESFQKSILNQGLFL